MAFLPKGWELVIILIVVLIIFGPKNLPKLGRAIGSGLKNLRKGIKSGKNKIDEKFEDVEAEKNADAPDVSDDDDAEVVVEEILEEDESENDTEDAVEEAEIVDGQSDASNQDEATESSSSAPKKRVVKRVMKKSTESEDSE